MMEKVVKWRRKGNVFKKEPQNITKLPSSSGFKCRPVSFVNSEVLNLAKQAIKQTALLAVELLCQANFFNQNRPTVAYAKGHHYYLSIEKLHQKVALKLQGGSQGRQHKKVIMFSRILLKRYCHDVVMQAYLF